MNFSLDDFRVVAERKAPVGELPPGCSSNVQEQTLFSDGVMAFVRIGDDDPHIYTKLILNPELMISTLIHEPKHLINELIPAFNIDEFYIDEKNLMKKLSFHGMGQYGQDILSDKNHFVHYLMKNDGFLQSFLAQLSWFTDGETDNSKIRNFERDFMGKNAVKYRDLYGEDADKKRGALREVMEIAFKNHPFLLYLLDQNPDLMVAVFHAVLKQVQQLLQVDENQNLVNPEAISSLFVQAASSILNADKPAAPVTGPSGYTPRRQP